MERRIYAREFRSLLGYGPTWFRMQQRRGLVPQGRVDPGGRRQWFTPAEVAATLALLRDHAETGPASAGSARGDDETNGTGAAGSGARPTRAGSEYPAPSGTP